MANDGTRLGAVDISNWIALGTLLVALAGVIGGLIALAQGNRQRKLELGSLYIQRYWKIDDDLLKFDKRSQEHGQARHRYVRLCEDEFEAARYRWLDKGQWQVWHKWLTAPRAAELISRDLYSCDPEEKEFILLRKCVRKTFESGTQIHTWAECPAREKEA